MQGNRNQRSSGCNSTAIHSYLLPYPSQQASTSLQQQTQQTSQLQQRDNNRGSLQKALSPTRSSTQKQVAMLKYNSKNQSHNSFKEDSISSKIGTSSSLLKNGNTMVGGGGILDGYKVKPDTSLSPNVKTTNGQKNALVSPQQIKQSTQNLTFLLTKGKESKSQEPSNHTNYKNDASEKQNQRGFNYGHNDIYQTPQSKLNPSTLISQQQINENSNSLYNNHLTQNGYGNNNHEPFTPSNHSNNICTINLCDQQDILKNISSNSRNNTPQSNIDMNGNIAPKTQVNSQHNNRLGQQSHSSPLNSSNSSSNAVTKNAQSSITSSKNTYLGYIRNGSQQTNIQQRTPTPNQYQNSSTDIKGTFQKTKYIDLASPLPQQQKKQATLNSQQQYPISNGNQIQTNKSIIQGLSANPYDGSISMPLNKNSSNGIGSQSRNGQQITRTSESDQDNTRQQQHNQINQNKQSSFTQNKVIQQQSEEYIKQLHSPIQAIDSRTDNNNNNHNTGNEQKNKAELYNKQIEQLQFAEAVSPQRQQNQEINILQECDRNNNNNICFSCKNQKARYLIVNSNLCNVYFCQKCGQEYAQKQLVYNNIVSNSISSIGIGSGAESYLSPTQTNANPFNLQTIDLRLHDQLNKSSNPTQQGMISKHGQKDEQLKFDSFQNNKMQSYINQMIPLDKIKKENEEYDLSIQVSQPQVLPAQGKSIQTTQSPSVNQKTNLIMNFELQQNDRTDLVGKSNQQSKLMKQENDINASGKYTQNYLTQMYTLSQQNYQQAISNSIDENRTADQLSNEQLYQDTCAYQPQKIKGESDQKENVAAVVVGQYPQTQQQLNVAYQKDTNNLSSITEYSKHIQSKDNINSNIIGSVDQISQYKQQTPIQNNISTIQTQGDLEEEEQRDDEIIKREKLNNFQSRLFKVKGDFENIQKLFTEKNDTSMQEYHKNIEYIEKIQKTVIGAIEEVTSKAKDTMLNNFNESLSKCKASKFEIQQILNYLNCTENDLMTNLDSIIKDMDIDSLSDIISQYDTIITQYDEMRSKKFLSQQFGIYSMKYLNDSSQLNIYCQKIQEGVQQLLTTINYTQNIMRNQINTTSIMANNNIYAIDSTGKSQQLALQNSFLNQQPKSIYISFENKDIFQSVVHSTSEQLHPETQPQSPSFQSTFSLQASQTQSQAAPQFLTFKDIIQNDENNQTQKFFQQIQTSLQLSQGQQQIQNAQTQLPSSLHQQSNLVSSKHLYTTNNVIQRSSFGEDQNVHRDINYGSAPPDQQSEKYSSKQENALTYQQIINNKNNKEDNDKVILPKQYQSNDDYKQNYLNYTSVQSYEQNIPLSTKTQNVTLSQLTIDYSTKSKRRIMSDVNSGSGDKGQRNNYTDIVNENNNHITVFNEDHDKNKSEDFKSYYQNKDRGNEQDGRVLFRSEENLFGKINNHNNKVSNISSTTATTQNQNGCQSQNHSEDFQFNQSTLSSNNSHHHHHHNLSFKNKQKYNDLLQKIQVNQSHTEKLCTDVLSSGSNFKFSQLEDHLSPSSSQNLTRQSCQLTISKK